MPFALHECCHIENSVGLHRKQLLCDCYHNRHRALNHTGSTDMLSPACDDLCISGTAVVWQQTFLNYNDNSQLSFMISVTGCYRVCRHRLTLSYQSSQERQSHTTVHTAQLLAKSSTAIMNKPLTRQLGQVRSLFASEMMVLLNLCGCGVHVTLSVSRLLHISRL
jgi:hypothetical protein